MNGNDSENRLTQTKRKSVYAALIICVGAAAIFTWIAAGGLFAQDTNNGRPPVTQQEGGTDWPSKETEVKQGGIGVPNGSSLLPDGADTPTQGGVLPEELDELPTAQEQQQPLYMLPVQGKIITAFSGEELVYNKTMADWRTHNGIDITAKADADIVAAGGGKVTFVGEKGVWGQVVEVTSDNVLMRYSGIKATVKAGDEVNTGDSIGKVLPSQAEIALEPHMHFEVEVGGILKDPVAFING